MTHRLQLLAKDPEPCPCCACIMDLDAPCAYGDRDLDGVELMHAARGVHGVFVWASTVAFATFVAIAYLLATL